MLGEHTITEVLVFFGLVAFCLWLDLHFHRNDKPVSARDAAMWTTGWVSLAMLFAGYIGFTEGADKAQLFLAGYLLEESLSVDNLFVMMAIFGSFSIRDNMQHRVLYYGILGAMVMRLIFVAAGTSLVAAFGPYALAGFGLFVLWTAWKMWQAMHSEKEEIVDYSSHWAVRWTQKFIPVYTHLHGHDFFVRTDANGTPVEAPKKHVEGGTVKLAEKPVGKVIWRATPLFLCLVVIEISDIMFAFDSVPAVLAITPDPFIVYTSNIFAILGLRSMFFLLAAAKRYLRHLEKSVIAILAFGFALVYLATILYLWLPCRQMTGFGFFDAVFYSYRLMVGVRGKLVLSLAISAVGMFFILVACSLLPEAAFYVIGLILLMFLFLNFVVRMETLYFETDKLDREDILRHKWEY